MKEVREMDRSIKKDASICEAPHIDAAHEAQIRALIPTEDEAADAAALFAQLSDSTRVRLVSMLACSDMCVCEMADLLGVSQPAVSHHLRILRQCGVVRFRKQGKRALYYLSDNEAGHMARKLLSAVCGEKEASHA